MPVNLDDAVSQAALPHAPPPLESTAPAAAGEASGAKPLIELRGRIHADAIGVAQSARDKAIIGDVPSATGFRRARLGAQGTIGEQIDWVAEFDFAGGK